MERWSFPHPLHLASQFPAKMLLSAHLCGGDGGGRVYPLLFGGTNSTQIGVNFLIKLNTVCVCCMYVCRRRWTAVLWSLIRVNTVPQLLSLPVWHFSFRFGKMPFLFFSLARLCHSSSLLLLLQRSLLFFLFLSKSGLISYNNLIRWL